MAYEMPEQPTDGQDDGAWTPRMPQDSFGDLFGDATEASNKGAYTEWSQGLANAQLLNLETPDSFVESAVLQSDDEWHLVEGLIKFGRAQLDSPCNNRIEKLKTLAKERELLSDMVKAYEDGKVYAASPEDLQLEDEWQRYLFAVLPEIRDETSQGIAEARIRDLMEQSATLQASMRQDMEAGYFRDYGEYKALFNVLDPDKRLNGRKALLSPSFTKEAMGICIVSMQNTRRGNTQALFARLLNTITGNYEKQRRLQRPFGGGGRGGRGGRGRRGNNQDTPEDDD